MIESSAAIERLLRMKEENPEEYDVFIRKYGKMYCYSWERVEKTYDIKDK